MGDAVGDPAIHLIYRLYAGSNTKSRPSFFAKDNCFRSFLRASSQLGSADLHLLVDGTLPDDFRALAHSADASIHFLPSGQSGMRGSYRHALRMTWGSPWPDDDVVYFSEDDYLYRLDAFVELRTFARSAPEIDYFTLQAAHPQHSYFTAPAGWHPEPPVSVGPISWHNVPSTTSSFGARLGRLRRDRVIFGAGMRPYRHRLLDHETCLTYQGCPPYTAKTTVWGTAGGRLPERLVKNVLMAPFRTHMQILALRRRADPALLYAPLPELSSHLEFPFVDVEIWAAEAEAAARYSPSSNRGA